MKRWMSRRTAVRLPAASAARCADVYRRTCVSATPPHPPSKHLFFSFLPSSCPILSLPPSLSLSALSIAWVWQHPPPHRTLPLAIPPFAHKQRWRQPPPPSVHTSAGCLQACSRFQALLFLFVLLMFAKQTWALQTEARSPLRKGGRSLNHRPKKDLLHS